MAENPGVQQAVQQAISEALGSIERQLGEVESTFQNVQRALDAASGQHTADRFATLLAPLMHMQAAGAALAASIETVLRFVGVSAVWTGAPAGAGVAAPTAEAAPAPVSAAAPAETPAEVEAAAAPAEEPAAAAEPEVAPTPAAAPVDVSSLPDDLQQLHKKAKRFARVTVQELFMYKKDEVEKGRQFRDLYHRFKEEIDKSKALYDQRFEKIAEHNVDYLYDELVRVLAENDPGALGDYPYPTPASHS